MPDTKLTNLLEDTDPVDADLFYIVTTAGEIPSPVSRRITWANIKTAIGTKLGAIINSLTGKTTPVDADEFTISDSAASNATKKLTWANLKATLLANIPLAFGTYTPTLYNTTNVAASSLNQDFLYMRVGNMVIVVGAVQIDPTAAAPTNTTLGISLPIASAFTTSYDLNGNATNPGTTGQFGSVIADDTNDRASLSFGATNAANAFWRIMFMYRVI